MTQFEKMLEELHAEQVERDCAECGQVFRAFPDDPDDKLCVICDDEVHADIRGDR